jgi:hypothetical protein
MFFRFSFRFSTIMIMRMAVPSPSCHAHPAPHLWNHHTALGACIRVCQAFFVEWLCTKFLELRLELDILGRESWVTFRGHGSGITSALVPAHARAWHPRTNNGPQNTGRLHESCTSAAIRTLWTNSAGEIAASVARGTHKDSKMSMTTIMKQKNPGKRLHKDMHHAQRPCMHSETISFSLKAAV